MSKIVRWGLRFQVEPGRFVLVAGKPKWRPERVWEEAERVYGPVLHGFGIPSHMRVKPRFAIIHGVKNFGRLDRMGDCRRIRLVA